MGTGDSSDFSDAPAILETTGCTPQELAEAAELSYVGNGQPGYVRLRRGRGFTYRDAQGRTVRDPKLRKRFAALAIPPAWTDIWICPDPNGHILATGRDSAGRKQYIYHPRWGEVRGGVKYGRLRAFGEALPALRRQVATDLRRRTLSREKVTALVIRLMEETLIRIGNDEYARHNDSYGLTTMQDEHVEIDGSSLVFEFRGKSGKEHEVALRDRRLAQLVKACQELPGQRLFQYVDSAGELCSLTSTEVNHYLRSATGEEFSAKDFRTWGGTVLAARTLHEIGPGKDSAQIKQNVTAAVAQIAEALGNTPAICRQHYIHPVILSAYENGALESAYRKVARRKAVQDLDEAAALLVLQGAEGKTR